MASIDTYTQVVASAIFKNAGVKPYLLFGGQRYAKINQKILLIKIGYLGFSFYLFLTENLCQTPSTSR